MAPLDVLIVDDDPWIAQLVATVVERRGHRPHAASDGEEGLARAAEVPPDLVVADVIMPRMDGWAFVRALRTRPGLALVPVVFLTSLGAEEDRIRGFRLGADDWLAKPFRFEELDLRIGNALRRREEVRAAAARVGAGTAIVGAGVQGSLGQLGLAALLVVMEMERKSGVLVVERGGESGRVFVREGRVVAAAADRGARGAEAVYRLLGWSDGNFEFTALDVEMADELGLSTTHLLLEAARRMDEEPQPGA